MTDDPNHGHRGAGGIGDDATVRMAALIASVIAIVACWPLVRMHIPADAQFAFGDLIREHWTHRDQLQPWLDRRWAWLALHNYHLRFAAAMLPGVAAIGIVQAIARLSIRPLLLAPVGWAAGLGLGYLLYDSFRTDSWPAAVMMPGTFAFLGGAIAARLAARPSKVRHLRGTKLKPNGGRWRAWLRARLNDGVALAGVPLSREDETMHVAAIGATGSGKSTALRALMAGALARGDRHVVADPDGASMSAFFAEGDIILNPFDRRCARWDLLAEIEGPSDFAFIAQSLLPHLGRGDHDQWISYGHRLLADTMESFVTLKLGGSDDYVATIAGAKIAELRQLCEGTPSARYFEEGGERMLASILGTIAPAVGNLRLIRAAEGEAFSVRRWIRAGQGSLWVPYAANQVAALRGLVSCWMNIALLETLSLEPSTERRIWFHVDELDALGRIEGLKDAQARLRKFGGCMAIGFQSFAQVKQIYGDGAQTIIENCGNLLILRAGGSDGGGTAKLASQLIGGREIERDNVSRSRSRGKHVSRSTSMQTRRVVEDVALASEIMQLPNREGFLKRATSPDWLRVAFPYVAYPVRAGPFSTQEANRSESAEGPGDHEDR